jgi:hypothetical protein
MVRLPSMIVYANCVPAGCEGSAANGAFQLPPPLTPLKPPVPTTPPVDGEYVPVISFSGSPRSTSFTPLPRESPPNELLRVPAYE